MQQISVAIDGPSASGKSTLAKALAEALQFIYVDTGAMYRTIGLYVARKGVDPADEGSVAACLGEIEIEIRHKEGEQHIYLLGEDVSESIRTEQASRYASEVSSIVPVRDFLLEMQRDFARRHNVIMDGRDIGTVVLPDATVKIFLTASAQERAKRRHLEQLARGQQVSFEEVYQAILQRDEHDSTRAAAPLRAAEDAVWVDTTAMGQQEAFEYVKQIIVEKMG